ncbi:hypothetical protein LP419_19710 [Massilia sp. H-1]|nr:hypothetical protein LP419_19710 [Massilia sp. H-1]
MVANSIKADVSEATRSMLNVLIMTDPEPDRQGNGQYRGPAMPWRPRPWPN